MTPDELAFFDMLAREVYGEAYLPKQKIVIHPTQKNYADVCMKYAPNMSTALDVGCCWGWLVRELRLAGVAAWGIDLSAAVVNQIDDWWKHFTKIGNIIELPWENNKFDFVNAKDVLEHVPPAFTERAIRELHRVCRWRTLIVCPTISAARLTEELKYDTPDAIFDHYVTYKPETWLELFEQFDWKRVDIPLESPLEYEAGRKLYFLYEKEAA